MEMGPSDDSPRLPAEVLHLVAQHIRIRAIEEKDRETVKTCSLVFSGWTIIFQSALVKIRAPSLIFSTGTPLLMRGGSELVDLLKANPGFGKAITSLHLDIVDTGILDPDDSTPDTGFPFLLSHLTSIDTFRIRQTRSIARHASWSILPKDVRAALRVLFRSPSLQNLAVSSFDAPLAIMFPEGAKMDTVEISSDRPPKVQDDHGPDYFDLPDDSGIRLELRPFTRSCIVRHLTSMAQLALKFLRATHHGGQSDGMPIIDSSGIHSAHIGMEHQGQLQDLHAILRQTHNLKRLMVGDPRKIAGIEGLFQEPHPRCLGILEEIELFFYWASRPGTILPTILHEFSAYPPENAVKRIIMNIPSFAPGRPPLPTEEVKSQLLALAELLSNTSRFPLLECVEMIPETKTRFRMGRWDEDPDVKLLPDLMAEIVMELPKLRPGFKLTVRTEEKDT